LHFEGLDQTHLSYQLVDHIGMGKYIDALAPGHKILIEYIYLKGYTHEEAAKILEIPLGTVKSRLKVAISILKKQLT
jgi:RNA polymerase sigma-70 factor (ECF subfamily)